MEYRINVDGNTATVKFSGDITFSENVGFRQILKEVNEAKVSKSIFDLSNVEMIDSAGLGMFLIAKEQSENHGWKLMVTGASGHVASMLKLTKLSTLLETE